jgi:alkyl hydroperoxide reductase subunit AhpF
MYDLAIIGGGPAGVAAGVYAARKKIKTIFIAETIGGQSTDSVGIENWIGTPKIAGLDLAKALEMRILRRMLTTLWSSNLAHEPSSLAQRKRIF